MAMGKSDTGLNLFWRVYISGAADFWWQRGTVIPYQKRWKAYTNDLGHLLLLLSTTGGGGGGGRGYLAGFFHKFGPTVQGLVHLKKAVNQRLPQGELLAGLWKVKSHAIPWPWGKWLVHNKDICSHLHLHFWHCFHAKIQTNLLKYCFRCHK